MTLWSKEQNKQRPKSSRMPTYSLLPGEVNTSELDTKSLVATSPHPLGRIGYLIFTVSGFPNTLECPMKVGVVQKWVDWLHLPCYRMT